MSSRRGHSLPPPAMIEPPPRSRCIRAICISWKVLTCVVSHVTLVSLVVAYCIGGALLFQYLEQDNEKAVKRKVETIRANVTNYIWMMTNELRVLEEKNWTNVVQNRLATFEAEILTIMKTEGWDGDENEKQNQWTFFGALFYSIIVITTIGYGHIAPRTQWGKVTTIFYAILGIPLMLLCLSNIGDVMATSFRFIYWRVCCFVCTREPKRNRRSRQRSTRPLNHRYSSRSQPPPSASIRRSIKHSVRSADSGFDNCEPGMVHSYSDPDMRHNRNSRFDRDAFVDRDRERDRYSGRYNREQEYFEDDYDRNMRYDDRGYTRSLNRNGRFSNRQRNYGQGRDVNRSRDYERNCDYVRSRDRDYDYRGRDRDRDRDYDREYDPYMADRERNRTMSRSKQQIEMDQQRMYDEPSKRAQSVRSVRGPSMPRESHRGNHSNTLPHPSRSRSNPNTTKIRAKSVDPRSVPQPYQVEDEDLGKTPILCNRYALEDLNRREPTYNRSHSMPRPPKRDIYAENDIVQTQQSRYEPQQQKQMAPSSQARHSGRRSSLQRPPQPSRYGNRLELPEFSSSHNNHMKRSRSSQRYDEYDDDSLADDYEMQERMQPSPARNYDRRQQQQRRMRHLDQLPPSPRIMSPMGFARSRQPRTRPMPDDDDFYFDDEWDSYADISPKDRPVPIWLCVFLVVSYIIAGAFLFHRWESWTFLDSAYFCFITLTTIGFGDFVPARGVKENSQESIALCSLYLLFGIALLAMSFNLVQEEFIANVKEVARRLGILKEEEEDD